MRQYREVIPNFVDYVCRDLRLKPVWMLVSEEVRQLLDEKMGWRTLSCVGEQRVDADSHHGWENQQGARRVKREGIMIHEVIEPDEDFMHRANDAIQELRARRQGKGKQVHLTDVRPWVDREHRRCFAAEKEGKVLSLVVLAQLAPSGTIEVFIEAALSALSGPVTFGVGVSERLTPRSQLSGIRARFLANTYDVIVKTLRLGGKAQFREKFGVLGEQVDICYPRHGLDVMDLQQIVKFFQD
ncbi:hypothetical protein F4776DRAFT_605011 [Hypoxylon sp. NC0597]|nr:hypothetical protein F4776DRAFT_605011 [Hypoxylon sp. NC0597]